MVQAKKVSEQTNGTSKHNKDQQSNMSFQRKESSGARGGDGRSQNGNASSFRTDSAISGNRGQGERVLQKWVPDATVATDGGLESGSKSTGAWDQFAENKRRFGITTDYDENIYTTTIDKAHPMYKQRLAEADKKAREIERSSTNNAHVAEERITDNLTGDGGDEEDKYSGVRRQNQQDFPPLSSSNNKYTPPARRGPPAQPSAKVAHVDPAIISAQIRSDKQTVEKVKSIPAAASPKPVETAAAVPSTKESSTTTPESKDLKPAAPSTSSSSIRKPSPQARAGDPPNATATVEHDVTQAFKGFAAQQRKTVENARVTKARNDKQVKLNDLREFADTFKLHTPVPSDLVSIIAKDPAKQKEIQEKAKRNAEEAKAHPVETAKPVAPIPESKAASRPGPASHGTSPSTIPSRQNTSARNNGFAHQGQYNSQSYRNDRGSQSQQPTPQQNRQPGNLGARLRNIEQNKLNQTSPHPTQGNDVRQPPTGPSNNVDSNFSRRSSGVTSAQSARLNPNSNEFRPSPFAASFSPNGNPSTASSPRSALNTVASAPITRSLLKRKPIAKADRPSIADKFNSLEHIKSIKPVPEKNWKATGGLKPAYDTPPVWKTAGLEDKPDSTIHLTYTKLFEMAPFPAQTMSPPHPSHVAPQVPHQHQLPFHLQQNVHMAPRQSPRQPQMNMGGHHGHGPNPSFNNGDDHRMMPSHSAQSFASPRMQNNVPMAFPSPMNQPAQLAYNPAMMPYPGGPPMAYRSMSQNQQFMPQQGHMGPQIMMQNPGPGFLAASGMAPGPPLMYPQGQPPFMPPGNGHPPAMPGVNGYPSPGRGGAPMMMSQGSQQGHGNQQPIYNMNPGMSPSPGYAPMYAQQPPGQMPMRGGGYGGAPNHFGTSPQQMHQFGNQHRNNHQNGNYNNNKNFQAHGQHSNGQPNSSVPSGPQVRNAEGGEESK